MATAAIIGSAVIGGGLAYYGATRGAETAAEAQTQASSAASAAELQATRESIAEQRRQFDEIQALLQPYVSAGNTALTQQMNLVGLGGTEAQQQAINAIEQSPQYTSLVRTGEEAILQNASATGGLRGGNVQQALAEYRPSVLSQLIENQYSKLSDLTNVGQASATGTAAASQSSSNNISSLLQSMGSSISSNYINAGNAAAQSALISGQALGNLGSSIAGSVPLAIYAGKKW